MSETSNGETWHQLTSANVEEVVAELDDVLAGRVVTYAIWQPGMARRTVGSYAVVGLMMASSLAGLDLSVLYLDLLDVTAPEMILFGVGPKHVARYRLRTDGDGKRLVQFQDYLATIHELRVLG